MLAKVKISPNDQGSVPCNFVEGPESIVGFL